MNRSSLSGCPPTAGRKVSQKVNVPPVTEQVTPKKEAALVVYSLVAGPGVQ